MIKTREIPQLSQEDIIRFWGKVKRTNNLSDCWEWQKYKIKGGYGLFRLNKSHYLAHRVAYFIVNGKIPKNLFVLHSCDNPACCNISHHFLGTTTDNMIDRKNKGRGNHPSGDRSGMRKHPELVRRGVQLHNAILNNNKVLVIRQLYKELEYPPIKQFAESLGYSHQLIRGIVWNRTWVHLLTEKDKVKNPLNDK